MDGHLQRAVDALERGAAEIRGMTAAPASQIRACLRATADEVLGHLEADREHSGAEPEDIISALDRQSREIAEDLRRVDRLMRDRLGQE